MNVHKVVGERRTTHGIGMYLRKSTEQQPFSLAAQERIIRQAIVEPSGLPVYRVYTDVLL